METWYCRVNSREIALSAMYHVLPPRVADCEYCHVEQRDPRDRWQVTREGLEEHRSCQPIKAVRWLVRLEHEGTSG